MGVPRYARARYEISGKGEQRSPFVRKMWEFVDSYAYRQAPIDKADRMLRDAYDAIQEAADTAVGRGKGDPAAGRNALAAIIRTENHGPAWQLAARMAFENDIDLGIDYFNPQAYAAARNSGSVEVMRTLYGTDPTYGYGGTAAKRADRQQAAGVTEADRSGFFDMLRKVR